MVLGPHDRLVVENGGIMDVGGPDASEEEEHEVGEVVDGEEGEGYEVG